MQCLEGEKYNFVFYTDSLMSSSRKVTNVASDGTRAHSLINVNWPRFSDSVSV